MHLSAVIVGAAHLMMKRYTGSFWIRRRWLDKTQWLDPNEMQELQFRLLRRLVVHCYQTVPYYRQMMMERGINPHDIRCLDDIRRFPILTKDEVVKAGRSLISTKYPRLLLRTAVTGGTTGTPLHVWRTPFSIGDEHAFLRRQWDWAGIGLRDRTAYLSWREVCKPSCSDGPLHAYDPFMKELILSTYHLSPATVGDYVRLIKHYGIKALVGYPSAIAFVARWCLSSGIRVPLQAVLTTSETLSWEMRECIGSSFSCSVFDYYGSAERVCCIHTCPCGTYHIVPEYGYVELRPEDGIEGRGFRVIATGFWNLAMPLLRYDTGDVVEPSDGECCCGRLFPVVTAVLGRSGDTIVTPSGRLLGATLMARVARGMSNILEVQFCQDAVNHLEFRYVPGAGFSAQDLLHFQARMSHYLGSEVQITYRQTDRVERTTSGKAPFILSQIGRTGHSCV